MEICIGMIGMQPSEFWNASPIEIHSSIDGFAEFNSSADERAPLDKDELNNLMELHPD